MSLGLPPNDCFRQALNDSADKAQLVGNFLVIIASMAIFTLPFTIPLCTGYGNKTTYTDEDQIHDINLNDKK